MVSINNFKKIIKKDLMHFEQGEKSVYASLLAAWLLSLISGLWTPLLASKLSFDNQNLLNIINNTILVFILYPLIYLIRKWISTGYITRRKPYRYMIHILIGLILTLLLHPTNYFQIDGNPLKLFFFYLNWALYTFLSMNIRAYFSRSVQLNNHLKKIKELCSEKERLNEISNLFTEYVNRALTYIKISYDDILGGVSLRKIDAISEEEFKLKWEPVIEKSLFYCGTMKSFSENTANPDTWAAVYFLEDDKFENNIAWFSNRIPPDIKREIKLDKSKAGILSWVLNEFENQTRKYIDERKRPWRECSDIVLRESLPEVSPIQKSIPARSAIALRLEYHNIQIGILIVASMTENYFKEKDVFPIIIISRLVISSYAHHTEFCPWHRKGWRNNIGKTMHTDTKRFVFFPDKCEPDRVQSIIENSAIIGCSKEKLLRIFHNDYMDRFKNIYSNRHKIEAVYLRGSFNGWKPDHLAMIKSTIGSNISWTIELNLPEGWYNFGYVIKFKDNIINEMHVFEPEGAKIKNKLENMDVIDTGIYIP